MTSRDDPVDPDRFVDNGHWAAYNAAQRTRDVRPLCLDVIARAGEGGGRLAIDLGCGAGRETRALLAAGWRVHAIDGEPTARDSLSDLDPDRSTIHIVRFAELDTLPPADLVFAGNSLPFAGPDAFGPVWGLIRAALRPGGWLAVNLFGDHDSWAGNPHVAFHTEPAARRLFDGLDVVSFEERDEDGTAFTGPKHWHLFTVVARAA